MKFSKFIKTFNGNLVSVSDNNQHYDVRGRHCL